MKTFDSPSLTKFEMDGFLARTDRYINSIDWCSKLRTICKTLHEINTLVANLLDYGSPFLRCAADYLIQISFAALMVLSLAGLTCVYLMSLLVLKFCSICDEVRGSALVRFQRESLLFIQGSIRDFSEFLLGEHMAETFIPSPHCSKNDSVYGKALARMLSADGANIDPSSLRIKVVAKKQPQEIYENEEDDAIENSR